MLVRVSLHIFSFQRTTVEISHVVRFGAISSTLCSTSVAANTLGHHDREETEHAYVGRLFDVDD